MSIETAGLVAVIIMALDIWAATAVIGARRSWRVKLVWILLLLLLPLVGFLVWLLAGPRPERRGH